MSKDLNTTFIIGRLTADAELKYLQSGTAITSFSIANNNIYMSNNEKKEEVSYFSCVLWGKAAEGLQQYLTKGKRIAVEGRLRQQRWQTQDGTNRSKIEIVVNSLQFLDVQNQRTDVQNQREEPIDDSPVGREFQGIVVDNPFDDSLIPF